MRFPYFTLPSSQSIRQNRMLKPFHRYLHHHFLWQCNRRTVAGGLAAGLFCGLIFPVGQIVLAALAALVFRVNLPVAALSTLVTNPLTVGPIYYAAYRLGNLLTGGAGVPDGIMAVHYAGLAGLGPQLLEWLHGVGVPLMLGLGTFALGAAVLGYGLVRAAWRWHAGRRWARRGRGRHAPVAG